MLFFIIKKIKKHILNIKEELRMLTEHLDSANIIPNGFVEIGSCDGEDAHLIANIYNLPKEHVHIVEPNSIMADNIAKKFPYKLYNCACSNYNKQNAIFYAARDLDDGRSSLLNRPDIYMHEGFDQTTVEVTTFCDLINRNNIKHYNVVKIDVEGAAYEVNYIY